MATLWHVHVKCVHREIASHLAGMKYVVENEASFPPPDFGTLFDHFSIVEWKLEDENRWFTKHKDKEFSR